MEDKESSIPRGIPRLSRLPVPRASATDSRHHDSHKVSQLPRPSATGSLRSKSRTPLSETTDQLSSIRHGRLGQQSKPLYPVKHVQTADQGESSESTFLKHDPFDEPQVDENAALDVSQAHGQKRKPPRPSLSERTMETLSLIPPSPSPSRPRPGTATGHYSMMPPTTPVSVLRSSRSNATLRDRSSSPSKRSDYQFGYPKLRSTGMTPSRTAPSKIVQSPANSLTASSKIAVADSKRVSDHENVSTEDGQTQVSSSSSTPHSRQAKSAVGLKNTSSRPSTTRISLQANSQVSSRSITASKRPSLQPELSKDKEIRHSRPGAARKSIATATTSSVPKPRSLIPPTQNTHNTADASENRNKGPIYKSSLTLRETIAKAKAAKREANQKRPVTPSNSANGVSIPSTDFEVETLTLGDNSEKTLKKRIEGAVTSGVLNIAAMGMKVLPDGIRTMYDSDANPNMNWSEAVDLVKLNAADNEIEELSEAFFPDWSVQELQEDDDKSNQFGGLQILDFRGNQLTRLTIGLRRLEQLHTLILNNNRLEMNALETICQIHHLRELQLANNNLKGALPSALENLTELQVLDVRSNHVSTLPDSIARLYGLRKLDLSDNSFSVVPIVSLQGLPLVELNLSKNSLLGTLFHDGYSNERLQTLNVASNMLDTLSEDEFNFPALQTLICDNNRMKSLPNMSKLKSLVSLAAADNQIERFPDEFGCVKTLRNVDLSANQISVLDTQIASMQSLATLNVSANPLRERKYLTMSTDKLKMDLSKRLDAVEAAGETVDTDNVSRSGDTESVSVDDVEQRYVPEKGVLNLSSRNLKAIDLSTIDLAGPIHTVRLSNNDLAEFPEELLTHPNIKHSLRSLDLSHMPSLHSTDYLTHHLELPVLQSLNIVSAGLTSLGALLAHLSAPQLKELNVSCNRLAGPVPSMRTSFPALATLLAADNCFASIGAEAIAGLEVVDISNNDIDHLPPKIGELGNPEGGKPASGCLRTFVCTGNRFRVPRAIVLEKGTEAILKDLRRMIPAELVADVWK